MSTKLVNGVSVPLTPEEQSEFDAREVAHNLYMQSDEFHVSKMIRARREEYLSIGDQLDAILKYFEADGNVENPDLKRVLDHWRSVKDKYPKERVP